MAPSRSVVGEVLLIDDDKSSHESPGRKALSSLMFLQATFKILGHSDVNLSAFELNGVNDYGTHERKNGASEGIRTLDTHVGNVMLYQAELRSLPESAFYIKGNAT